MVRLLTRAEAATELRLSQRSLRRLNIPVVRIGRKPLYDPRDINRYARQAERWDRIRSDMSPLAQKMLDAIGWRDDVPRTSRVYFIRSGYYVKVGISTQVAARVEALQTGSPDEIKLIGDIRGDLFTEKAIHKAARKHHHRGEWYSLGLEMSIAVAELCDAEQML